MKLKSLVETTQCVPTRLFTLIRKTIGGAIAIVKFIGENQIGMEQDRLVIHTTESEDLLLNRDLIEM